MKSEEEKDQSSTLESVPRRAFKYSINRESTEVDNKVYLCCDVKNWGIFRCRDEEKEVVKYIAEGSTDSSKFHFPTYSN